MPADPAPNDRDEGLRRTFAFVETRRAWGARDLQRPYPKLDRAKRRNVRKVFFYGLLHPDAMHHAIWGVNEDRTAELGEEYGRRLLELRRSLRRLRAFAPEAVWRDVNEKVDELVVTMVTTGVRSGAESNERSGAIRLNQASDRS